MQSSKSNGKPISSTKPGTPRIASSAASIPKAVKQSSQSPAVNRDETTKQPKGGKDKSLKTGTSGTSGSSVSSTKSSVPDKKRRRVEERVVESPVEEDYVENMDLTKMEAEEVPEDITPEEAEELDAELEAAMPSNLEQVSTKEELVEQAEAAKDFIASAASSLADYMESIRLDLDSEISNKTVAKMLVHVLNGIHKLKQNPEASSKPNKHASYWTSKKVMAYLQELTSEGQDHDYTE